MSKIYLIKVENTGEVIRWEGSLIEFLDYYDFMWKGHTDNERRTFAKTRINGKFYKGYKVLFYGEEKPQQDEGEPYDTLPKGIDKKVLRENLTSEYEEVSNNVKGWVKPSKEHQPITFYKNKTPKKNVLVVGDLHLPFALKTALDFAKRVYNENDITDVIFIGDIIDNHFTGFHETDPDGYSANDELNYAMDEVKKWAEAFPNAKLIIGNHDRLPSRKAFTGGISKKWIKTIDEVLGIPWEVHDSITIGNFFFIHGEGQQAKSRAIDLSMSVVQGHYHSKLGCNIVSANRKNITFAIQTGCLVDHNAFAMAYGKRGKAMARGLVVIKDIEENPEIKIIPMPVELLD